jgi:hypothetical protein
VLYIRSARLTIRIAEGSGPAVTDGVLRDDDTLEPNSAYDAAFLLGDLLGFN